MMTQREGASLARICITGCNFLLKDFWVCSYMTWLNLWNVSPCTRQWKRKHRWALLHWCQLDLCPGHVCVSNERIPDPVSGIASWQEPDLHSPLPFCIWCMPISLVFFLLIPDGLCTPSGGSAGDPWPQEVPSEHSLWLPPSWNPTGMAPTQATTA